MNTINTLSAVRRFALATCLATPAFLLSGCGSGSGAQTVQNPVTTPPTVSNYNGPAPQTADVQRFKLNVWDNLVPNNRCGTCHNPSQTPRFVRNDDINLAYEAANTVVNLSDPANSRMVLKVRGGHNCWLTSNDACGDIIQSYIQAWAGGSVGGVGKAITFTAPPLRDPGSSKNFPSDPALFKANVYDPYLHEYCVGCHKEDAPVPQSPYFASDDIDVAYAAAQKKIDLDNPANSRFVIRLGTEFHNCWAENPPTVNCAQDAALMEAGITAMANAIPATVVDPSLVTSKALRLTDGIVASDGGRQEANVIAKYEFKTGSGNTAFDTSGVEPALNLTLSGSYSWVGGWGVAFNGGKAQGSTTASKKLYDLVNATGEYSIEAWVAPANVTQDGPSRIITYSGGTTSRNFMLGQTLYQYDFLNRSADTDQNGMPSLSTAAADEDLQATLQHVVATYDPTNGRRIYVNGKFTDDVDSVPGGVLSAWDNTFAFALGSEVDNTNKWAGTVRFVEIHNRALTPAQVKQNYDVGVGEKYYMLFNVSDYVGQPDAYVVFVVSQFDSYSYLFRSPFFMLLDSAATPGSIPVKGIRIGINGREASVGQAFKNVDTTITDAQYAAQGGRQELATIGGVIALEKGPTADEFFLTFEQLGSATHVVVEAAPPPPPTPVDVPRDASYGIRNFAEVNATMSTVTGVPTTQTDVLATYDAVFQALPVDSGIEGFLSSQQMGVTQLAISYCSALVDGKGSIPVATYFPGFNFGAPVSTAFDSAAKKSQVMDPLYTRIVGTNVSTQPDASATKTEVGNLIDSLASCSGVKCADTHGVVKAACASMLGSAAMLVQ
jgi:hypothetical protein